MTDNLQIQGHIQRLEEAEEAEEGALILDALTYAHASRWITTQQFNRAQKQLRCGAYVSAALTLVPEGRFWSLDNSATAFTSELGCGPQNITTSDAATPALALSSAALKERKAVG